MASTEGQDGQSRLLPSEGEVESVTMSEDQVESRPDSSDRMEEVSRPDSSEKVEVSMPSPTPKAEEEIEFIDPATGEGEGGGRQEPPAAADEAALVPEKLADDVMKPPLWRRVLYRVFPKLEKIEVRRELRANDAQFNSRFKYAKNAVFTSKYNIITFLPLNLFEQFLRVANLYFLGLLIIQVIPGVASVPFYTTLIPLVGVLSVTAIKDAFDDIKRHISDYKVNHRLAHILQPGGASRDRYWKDVKVGDVLRLEKDDFITADLLLLSSSEPNSLIYIETAELDGETNLKVRQPLPETAELEDDFSKLADFDGLVKCEPPNNRLHKFVGTLTWGGEEYSLDNEKIVLRGCRLRNTKWMYGLVVYAGHDTKLVQNSGRTKFKRTHLDSFMNRAVIFILCFLLVCVTICWIGSWIYESVHGAFFVGYAEYYSSAQDSPAEIAFLQILSSIVVLSNYVPISLYVSVEMIRLGLSLLINWDLKMYYEPEDVPAIARTTTLNEELGQIEYIFSDKTGTLTQNVMTFLKCTIHGVKYGEKTMESEFETVVATGEKVQRQKSTASSSTPEPIDFKSWNKYADEDFVYYDKEFLDLCRSGQNEDCDEFFKLLSLCHTVLPAMEDDKLIYNAQSPDEAALVKAAKNFGYVFLKRSPFNITVHKLSSGEEEEYEVLNILDFNNERKRMSIIVKHNDQITLYCKGADSVVFARLDKESADLKKTTLVHLGDYAREGLRTLVLAKKDLTEEEYTEWADDWHRANLLQDNREEELDKVYNRIEQNLSLMGATAIEDKLQDGVPETIANLAKANIKIWVLTGDKQETAINIGYSSKLLTEEMRVFVVDEDSREGVVRQLREANTAIIEAEGVDGRVTFRSLNEGGHGGEGTEGGMEDPTGPPFGIVLNGHSLRHALTDEVKLELLETASKCKAVICCRVTPLQKKRVVDLVKKNKKAVTLAIGDGANDVGMIKAAHIGIGISGREGQQAVLASDYSFGQFRFLERLLLVHGRWSYHRMTVFLRYFFYKNFAFTFCQFLFTFFSGFTAQTLYDPVYVSIYNVVYTSLPVLALGILDQDVNEHNCYRHPQLYVAGQKNENFNPPIFVRSLIKGLYVAVVFFFVYLGIVAFNVYPSGYEWDFQSVGLAASASLTLIVNLQVALDTFYWNPIMHLFVWGSILVWFVVIPVTSTAAFYGSFFTFGGVAFEVLSTANFWFYLPLSAIIALAPTMMFRLIQLYQKPQYIDFVRLKEKKEGRKIFKRKTILRKSSGPTRKATRRSGYAFSHQEGYGHLITTGRIFGLDEDNVAAEHTRRRSIIMSAKSSRGGTERPVSTISLPEKTPPVSINDAVVKAGLSATVTVEVVEDEQPVERTLSGKESSPPRDAATGAAVIVEGSEETDSALAPSIRIPGLVDSPSEEDKKGEDKENGSEDSTTEKGGDNQELVNLV